MNSNRNEQGIVSVTDDTGRVVTAKIPCDRSMLGMLATNGILPNGEYREDGWVYLNNKPVRKWHSRFEQITIWEPKMDNLTSLYDLYKKTNDNFNVVWKATFDIMMSIWDGKRPAKAHTYTNGSWWEFDIHDYGYGLGISVVSRLEEKPKKVTNVRAGNKLWKLDSRRSDLSKRCWKTRIIFFEALRRSLPKATANKILCLQFKADVFVFHSVSPYPTYHHWKMFDDRYSLETKRIV